MLDGPRVPNGATDNVKHQASFHQGSSPNPIYDPRARSTQPTASGADASRPPRSATTSRIIGWLNHNGYIRGGY